jgi:hypothetical protein
VIITFQRKGYHAAIFGAVKKLKKDCANCEGTACHASAAGDLHHSL